jgi:serine/threonine-protein kinase
MSLAGFEVVRRIGRGGTGEVLEAIRLGPGGFRRPVALKRLYGDAALRGDAIRRLIVEARVLAGLDHPNIVRVLDVVSADDGAVIVMELLSGITLAELAADAHASGTPLAARVVAAIADQALAGLAAAHAARDAAGAPLHVVHRDVTPRNLIVCDSGVVKLLDFGLAKLADQVDAPITREGLIHGTLELLAPEQACGEPPDAATDLYQLGATMYWALAGRFPHGTGTPAELVARAASRAAQPLRELRADLPAELVRVIERAMARARADRFASAAAMRAALAAAGAGAATLAELAAAVAGWRARHPETSGDPAAGSPASTPADERVALVESTARTRSSARRRGLAIAAAVAATGAAIGAIAWLRQRSGAADARPAPVIAEDVVTLLAGDDQPTGGAVSADGAWVYYAMPGGLVRKRLAQAGGTREMVGLPPGFAPDDVETIAGGDELLVTGQTADGEFQSWRLGAAHRLAYRAPAYYVARVAPDGRALAIAHTAAGTIELHHLDGGPPRPLVALPPGEIASGLAWSPAGDELGFVRIAADAGGDSIEAIAPATGARRVVLRRAFGTVGPPLFAWPAPDRIVYAVGGRDGATLYETAAAGGGGERAIHRWPGLAVQSGKWSGGRLVYTRGTARYGIYVHADGGWTRLLTGDGVARRLAGWTARGELVFAGDAAGTPDVIRQAPGARPAPWIGGDALDSPDTLAGDRVVFQRAAGDQLEVRIGHPDGTSDHVAAVAARDAAANVVRCAGDRAPPCVLEEVAGERVRYRLVDVDGTGGEPGRVVAEVPRRNRLLRNHAVAPAGDLLAIVDGTAALTLVALADGARRELAIGGGALLQSVAWSADGAEVLVTALQYTGASFAALAVDRAGAVRTITADDAVWRWRVQPAADGRLASVGIEFEMELAVMALGATRSR